MVFAKKTLPIILYF